MPRERRLAFGEVAELYDRARPSYPAALVDDVLELAALRPGQRALEVGAGTGKATVLFAQRGAAVHALEPSAEMAAIAQRNLARYRAVTIERVEFERWQQPESPFGLLFSGQAWHWISRETRYLKARSALAPGGLLAAFWNRPDWERCALREEIDAGYGRVAPHLLPNGPMRPGSSRWADEWPQEIGDSAAFAQPEIRTYSWDHSYSSGDYVQLLRTHSDHILLDRATKEALYRELAGVIDRHGGVLSITYLTRLCLARAV
jgi:protein-L-isoaspartate O-methyltransferase